METLFSILMGLGLPAACGFRVFVPLLVAGIGIHAGPPSLNSQHSTLNLLPLPSAPSHPNPRSRSQRPRTSARHLALAQGFLGCGRENTCLSSRCSAVMAPSCPVSKWT